MSGKPAKRPKHIPQRTCVGCRTVLPKRTLVRLVRQAEGVQIDPTGKLAGRGAYLHNQRSCWERAIKGALGHALKVTLTPEEIESFQQYLLTLPEDPGAGNA
ncbi:MAG: YlxR family protein [Chloroflexota bacterium]